MRELILVALLSMALGCSWNAWGLKGVAGAGYVGSECMVTADGAFCEEMVQGAEMGKPFADLAAGLVQAGMRMVDAVPGVELGGSDTLRVEIVPAPEE